MSISFSLVSGLYALLVGIHLHLVFSCEPECYAFSWALSGVVWFTCLKNVGSKLALLLEELV